MTRLFSSDPLQTITAPPISYHALAPVLIVLGAALVSVLAEALLPRASRFSAQVAITLLGLGAALVMVGTLHGTRVTTASRALSIDGVGLFLQGSILRTQRCPRELLPS